MTVTPTGATTTEAGGAVTVQVVLTAAPTGTVTVNLGLNDATEGDLSATQLQFTTGNWNVAQSFTVTGMDDSQSDGDIGHTLTLDPGGTAAYDALASSTVALTNTDHLTLAIQAVNDAPVNTVPGAQSTVQGSSLLFSTANGNAIAVADLDATVVEVTLTEGNGTITPASRGGPAPRCRARPPGARARTAARCRCPGRAATRTWPRSRWPRSSPREPGSGSPRRPTACR